MAIIRTLSPLGRLPYTTAVILETLRMYAPAGTMRQGGEGVYLADPTTGKSLPTAIEGQLLALADFGFTTGRNENNFPSPDLFDPDRGLTSNVNVRAFEKGPRHCIGFELAMTEMKIALTLTSRTIAIKEAYDVGAAEVMGDKAFMLLKANSMPSDGLPVKVSMIKASSV